MSVEIVTIPKVYLKDRSLWKSAYHTAHAGVHGKIAAPGQPDETVTLTFLFGVAYHVPETIYRIFADVGIATTDMPQRESAFGWPRG